MLEILKKQEGLELPALYGLFKTFSEFFCRLKLNTEGAPFRDIGVVKSEVTFGKSTKEWLLKGRDLENLLQRILKTEQI